MNIKAVNLWGKATRLVHWGLAGAVSFLAISGWLMGKVLDDAIFWIEWHQIIGQVIVFLLVARVVLFFQQGNSHYSRYKLGSKDAQTIKETLKFYLSLARTPLPAWYALNPVWRVLYAALYFMLVVMAFSGLVDANSLVFGLYWPPIHQSVATAVYIWLVLHLMAVFLHDSKSSVNRISAMLSGVAYFEAESETTHDSSHIIQTAFDLTKK